MSYKSVEMIKITSLDKKKDQEQLVHLVKNEKPSTDLK
jgi:hypothetical protein